MKISQVFTYKNKHNALFSMLLSKKRNAIFSYTTKVQKRFIKKSIFYFSCFSFVCLFCFGPQKGMAYVRIKHSHPYNATSCIFYSIFFRIFVRNVLMPSVSRRLMISNRVLNSSWIRSIWCGVCGLNRISVSR